ncbi:hypothetical protein Tco_1523787 [Tanacetum coccineum]
MAASGSSRAIARRVVDDIVDLSGEGKVPKYMRFFFLQQIAEDKAFANMLCNQAETARNCIVHLHVMICEMEAMDDRLVVYDSLECLRESKAIENNKLKALLDLIAQTEEAIRMKEGHVEVMDEAISVPLNAWTRSTFQKISSKWGELVELEDGSAKTIEQANNLNNDEVENASEVVSDTYFGDNGEVQGFEHQHGESNDKEIFLRAESVRPPSSRGHRIMSRVIEEAKTP